MVSSQKHTQLDRVLRRVFEYFLDPATMASIVGELPSRIKTISKFIKFGGLSLPVDSLIFGTVLSTFELPLPSSLGMEGVSAFMDSKR